MYLTEVDEVELIKAAFDEGCRLVPDHLYRTAELDELNSIVEFANVRQQVRHFFIFGAGDEIPRRAMRTIEKESESFFYLPPNVEKPSLEFLGGGIVTDDTGHKMIRSGFLEFSRSYWSHDSSRKLVSPQEIEQRFRRLVSVIKRHSIRIKPGKGVFRLGNDARLQLENGASLAGYEHWTQ